MESEGPRSSQANHPVALFTKILTISRKISYEKSYVPFTNVFVACLILRFHYEKLYPSNGLKWPFFPLQIIKIENEPTESISSILISEIVFENVTITICVQK